MKKYKVLFCPLDEIINSTSDGNTIGEYSLNLNVLKAIKRKKPEYVFILSNEERIRKNEITQDSVITLMNYVTNSISDYCQDVICDYMFCSSLDESNEDRMPNTGMLEFFRNNFINNYDFDKKDAMMIGSCQLYELTAENFGIYFEETSEYIKQ